MGDDVLYPNQLKPITENLSADETIRRLKALSQVFQEMGQDDDLYTNYIPLALHLASDHFLQNDSKDVQLLIACCIADILRVFAPEAPYKDSSHIKHIFLFLIKQLNGLKDPKDPAFKRYFYLLENLAYVKSFNMCFELADSQEIFCSLFTLMFRIVNDEHSVKVKSFMLDILAPLITESDSISNDLLDILLSNIIEPIKTQKKNAGALARELIIKTSDSLQPYVKSFLNDALLQDKPDKTYSCTAKLFDLIYELNVISPTILLEVLPQLECKLKATQESERLKSVALLARMFSEKDSKLAKQHNNLWKNFLGRFLDIAVAIRIKCVQSTMHFLLNHKQLRDDVVCVLKGRQHDADESVRYEVVIAIVETVKRDFPIVAESLDLLDILKERSLDKKFKIRKAAMNGLAIIYQKYLQMMRTQETVSDTTRVAVNWIKNKILNGYYKSTLEDQLMVERLLTTHLVPYNLPTEDRMKALYKLLATLDDNAMKAFVELQKNQMKMRKTVTDWVKMHRVKEVTADIQKELNRKANMISKYFNEPVKSQEFLIKFSQHLRKDRNLLIDVDIMLKRDVDCKQCVEHMTSVLKKLGQPVMTNLYYNTVKMLLNRVASVMIDRNGIEVLTKLVEQQLNYADNPHLKVKANGKKVPEEGADETQNETENETAPQVELDLLDDLNLSSEETSERGLKLLTILIYLFPAHFQHLDVLRPMISLLSFELEFVAPNIFKALTHLGRYKPLIESHPEIIEELAPICKAFALNGLPKQSKHAIRCLFVNSQSQTQDEDDLKYKLVRNIINTIFGDIVEGFNAALTPDSSDYRTAIVCLGHIAYNLPERFNVQLKNIVSRKIVKDLLVKEVNENRDSTEMYGDWCQEDQLPEEIKCRIEGLKTMARWLIGLKDNVSAAQKSFRMLNAFIAKQGDILDQGLLGAAEKSWLRLSAGKAMLKICEQKGVGDEFNAEQFYMLSSLMNDPVLQVREIFIRKLHKGLYKGIPHKCLPLDFMGFYALAGRERDRKLLHQLKTNYEADVNHRREYVKTVSSGGAKDALSQLSNILPDYILPFAIAVLAHSDIFNDLTDINQLKEVEKCLFFILEPLVCNSDTFCFSLYKTLLERMKHSKSAHKLTDDAINKKMWTLCDLTMHIILSKLKVVDLREYPLEQIQIPSMYFTPQSEDFDNRRDYLSKDYRDLDGSCPESEKQPESSVKVTSAQLVPVKREAVPGTKPVPKKARTS